MAGEDVDEDVADAFDVDAAVDDPAIVDAEAVAPNPPDMDNRELTDLHEDDVPICCWREGRPGRTYP
jgi:hypothetical protein